MIVFNYSSKKELKERIGQADDPIERNTTHVRVLKNRFAGITGRAAGLLYNQESGRMSEIMEEGL